MDGPALETMPNPEPYDDRDDDSGQFRRQYPDEAFLNALDGRAFAPTRAVAEAVGCSRETAYKTLQRLHEEGRVEKHDVGAAVAWSLAENAGGDPRNETAETDGEDVADEDDESDGESDGESGDGGASISRDAMYKPDDGGS